ncbi:replication protein A 14 kDa subunit-like [Babylonia areolata]|uniref:replication protein A 14 kDa subunit-like n=1 Tax=Babylonia areolata TaxID=304850 RepID=UPI003FD10A3B
MEARPRVNASTMPTYQGKHVCLLGKAKDVDNSGMYFTLTTSDEQDVRINMSVPLNEYVSGLVEVHGKVQGSSIACDNYVLFSEEAASSFDLSLYNQAVELTQKYPDKYIQGVTQEEGF